MIGFLFLNFSPQIFNENADGFGCSGVHVFVMISAKRKSFTIISSVAQ